MSTRHAWIVTNMIKNKQIVSLSLFSSPTLMSPLCHSNDALNAKESASKLSIWGKLGKMYLILVLY